jgi:hypothetical protein
MKLHVVALESYDDVASVRDRLSFVRAEQVLLVYPKQQLEPVLSRKLDLVLIQREAARRGLQLALVTTDPAVIEAAADLSISTFSSVRGSQRRAWKTPRGNVFTPAANRPANQPDARTLRLHASRLKVLSPQQRRNRQLLSLLLTISLITFAVVGGYLFLPSATLTLYPAQAQIDTQISLTADAALASIDVVARRLPARWETIEVESQASAPTTGIEDVPTSLASGIVQFQNLIESAVEIPAGTFLTSTGAKPARFRTLETAVLFAGVGQTASVLAQATEESAGPVGNIEANLVVNVEGDLGRLVAVRNPEPMRGGLVREQGIVAEADTEALLLLGRQKLRQDSLTYFAAALGNDQYIVPDSVSILNDGSEAPTFNAFVGDVADTLTLNLRARVRALVVDESLVRQALIALLSAQIPAGRQLLLPSIQYKRTSSSIAGDGQVVLGFSLAANMAAVISAEEVRQQVAGLDTESAAFLLNRNWLLDANRPPTFALWPAFFGRLPLLPARIEVRLGP